MTDENVDGIFKIILLGDSSVGKSTILTRYSMNVFNEDTSETIGIDFKNVDITIKNQLYKLQIWDTAGQERFRSFLSTYFQGTHGIVIIYDISNKDSFDHINSWIAEVKKTLKIEDIVILIIGNKNDLESERQVNKEMGVKFSEENGFLFFETSAKTNENDCVYKAFEIIANKLIEKFNYIPDKNVTNLANPDKISLNNKVVATEGKKCC